MNQQCWVKLNKLNFLGKNNPTCVLSYTVFTQPLGCH